MCNCIQTIIEDKSNQLTDGSKKFVARMLTTAIFFVSGQTRTISEVELTFVGQKKKKIVNMIHTYCPFCGVKYVK